MTAPRQPPHPSRLASLRATFFATPLDGVLTLALLVGVVWLVPPIFRWAILDATWIGESRAACSGEGACWAIISARWRQVLAGFYPEDHLWRVGAAMLALAAGVAPLRHRRIAALTLATAPLGVLAAFAFLGGAGILPRAPSDYWGGFSLNVLIGVGAAIFALPLGVLLALARRSSLPVVKGLAIAFIELVRGAPLIVLLFAASVVVPLLTPHGVSLDKLVRTLMVMTVFEAAYMAEAVRGGLQAVSPGQAEAARALGLGPVRAMALVILPQALRIATPALVNSFIGLFKGATLIYVIGVLDLTGVLRNAVTDHAWQGLELEAYVFAALVFWTSCFALSRWSAALEKRAGAPTRKVDDT